MQSSVYAAPGSNVAPLLITSSRTFTSDSVYRFLTGCGPGGAGSGGGTTGSAAGGAAAEFTFGAPILIIPGDVVSVVIPAPASGGAAGQQAGQANSTTLSVNGVLSFFFYRGNPSLVGSGSGGTANGGNETLSGLGLKSYGGGGGAGSSSTTTGAVGGSVANTHQQGTPAPIGLGTGGSGGATMFGTGGVSGSSPKLPGWGAGGAGGDINSAGQVGGASFVMLY